MSSSQINYFLTPGDQSAVRTVIFGSENSEIVDRKILKGSMTRRVIDNSLDLNDEPNDLVVCYKPMMNQIRSIISEVNEDGYIDTTRSYGIEYTKCFADSLVIRRGRLYVCYTYWEGQDKRRKGDDFVKWSRAIFTAVKKILIGHDGYYYGPEFDALCKTGRIKLSDSRTEAHIIT